ncbi:phosphatidylinositol 3,4,5-trisphosphate 5-phosphatase 1 isoform X3 [Gadus morhua]|uniref:phosphatidylinositol 3,4,5-trisphosphate 5-phosphatase 1 isoform X3 n=1 Tax=Gadus morhua TaxID=8049 RepID=UPI0011B725E1|nr:phosphatidylinositol 3,4,5-trisphosphate 5-phosphatase 1 isoform X3 [Gadus morhua]
MPHFQPWYHGTITRSRAEVLLSKAGRDGSFILRGSESILGAYALCVLYQNCVYTYRILPNEERQLSVQASEGVPNRFFSVLSDLVAAYYSPNMGLVTHLQHPVPKEDGLDDETEHTSCPPQLPPRNFPASDVTECREQALAELFLQRMQLVDLSAVPEEHQRALQEYFSSSLVLDAAQVHSGNHSLPSLKKLILGLCRNLNNEISRIVPSLEAFQTVLDQQIYPGIGRCRSQVSADPVQSMSSRLEQLTKLLHSIEEKAKGAVIESVGVDGGQKRSLIPPTFEVKSDSLGISTKLFLKVDVETGRLYFKKSKDGSEDKYYLQNKILQLIKSQKMPAKLAIVLETDKEKILKKDIIFYDTKKREGFCQLLQQLKNKHSAKPDPDMITVFVGTWNMGNAGPPQSLRSWFQSKGQGKTRDDTADHIPHDMYVIGTQEDPLGEKEWTDTVKNALRVITDISFKLISIQTLWNIRILVLAKPEHENRISHVFSDSVKTGIANTLGNKGAVGVSFMFNGTSFGFINSHLTSGSEKKLRRNQNYINILNILNSGDKKLNPFDITHRFTHLFWLGDLNYRIDLPSTEAENIVSKIKQQQYQELLGKDQLNMERDEGKVFLHFQEEEVTFPPTYRFERDTREKYAYTKAKATGTKYNLPSWCDRVLRKSYPLVHVVSQSYGCTTDIMTSDHSPVFATFEVGVTSQFVSKHDPRSASEGGIKFMNCTATLFTKSKTKFFIEFHSSCLEKIVKTSEGENTDVDNGSINVCFAELQLTPIISDPEYLLDQHILICVKSTDCDESYGESCVALRAAEACNTGFKVSLTHRGESTGTLTGVIQLHLTESKQTEKLYDFIKVEKDDHGSAKSKSGENRSAVPHTLEITNPSYMGVGVRGGYATDMGWSYTPKAGNISPKRHGHSRAPNTPDEAETGTEMFDNPLYAAMAMQSRREQELPRWDPPTPPPDAPRFPPPPDGEPDRAPKPTPRNRSFTCSEGKPPPLPASLAPGPKRPVVPQRSEGGVVLAAPRPPLPIKRAALLEPQPLHKPREPRDQHTRAPARPSQSLPANKHARE